MQNIDRQKITSTKIFITVFLPFTLGYFLTAFFNQINAVMSPYIMKSIPLTSNALGLMTSVYLLCFALFQLPLGILLDHYGPRRVQSILFMIATIGIVIFAVSHSFWQLTLGRAMIGLGMAAGLMAGFKSIRSWYSQESIPLMNGLMMGCGTLGAVFSTSPTSIILQWISWRYFLIFIAIVTFMIALLILLVSKDIKTQSASFSFSEQIKFLGKIYQSCYFWKIAPITAVCFAINMSIVGLWGGLWFVHVSHFTILESAHHLFVISIALILGIFSNGLIADKLIKCLKKPITVIIGFGLFLFILDQVEIVFGNTPGSYVLWFLFGFLGRSVTLSYAALTQYFPYHYSGKVITAINLLMFLSAFLMQYLIGLILHLLQLYDPLVSGAEAYQLTFLVMIVIQIIAFIWFCCNRVDVKII